MGVVNLVAHCFFEQSGTFKNEFKKLGVSAFDYDILNDFGETDYQIDLFDEIEKAYDDNVSIFDNISTNDLIFAFFPCTRFESQIIMAFKGTGYSLVKWTDLRKLEYSLKLHQELSLLYSMVSKLAIVCLRKKIPLIIENPYSTQHYLTRYWSLSPAVIDTNRMDWGDSFVKPTQYWFLNCLPKYNLVMDEPLVFNSKKRVDYLNCAALRSMITHDYARMFIRTYIL